MSFVTFGEIMLRLCPAEHGNKLRSSGLFEVGYAGSESNVASSLAVLGNRVGFVSKLPNNPLGDAAISSMASYGIDTQHVLRGGDRIGTYFIEIGASIRPSQVVYDRAQSAISQITADEFDWSSILSGQDWIFLSGITPVLSKQCAAETIKAATVAKELGVKVAFDMNYRRSLWRDASQARQVFDQILARTDLLLANAGVLQDVYEFQLSSDVEMNKTKEAIEKAAETFGVPHLAFTVREHVSASHNVLSAICQSPAGEFQSGTYAVDIKDRFGAGDAFAAAFLHAIGKDWSSDECVRFAAAAFALKHTIKGDQHTSNEAETLSVSLGNTRGHVLR